MTDTRRIVFPMTARDLVVSTLIVALSTVESPHPLPELWEVVDVEHVPAPPNFGGPAVISKVAATVALGDERTRFEFDPDTPLLLAGIRR